MAFCTPKAADFSCLYLGNPVPWNSAFGLRVRWMAAGLAKSCKPDDLQEAARTATQHVRDELNDNSVTIEVAK